MEVSGKIQESIDSEGGRSGDDNFFCEPCQGENIKTNADGVCRECEEYMCSMCFRHHLKGKFCKNHVLVAVHELQSAANKSSEEDIEKCKKHDNEAVKFYCRAHDVVGCGDCIILEHTACKPEYIKDLAKTFQEEEKFKEMFRKLDVIKTYKKESEERLKKNKSDIDLQNEKTLKEIRQFRRDINEYLDNAEAEITSEIEKVTSENTELQKKLEQDIKSLIADIEEVSQKFDRHHLSGNVSFIQAVTCKPKIEPFIKRYEEILAKHAHGLKTIRFVRPEKMSAILKSTEQFGKLQIDSDKPQKEMKLTDFFIGARVRRGPDWIWGNMDGGGPGTVFGFHESGWARVKWDAGGTYNYRIGQDNGFDLLIIL